MKKPRQYLSEVNILHFCLNVKTARYNRVEMKLLTQADCQVTQLKFTKRI
jgi:hypothetical protein